MLHENKYKKWFCFLFIVLLSFLSACGQKTNVDLSENRLNLAVTILEFDETENGAEPYITRMLVSDRYIRIDGGELSDDGYVLFDRLKRRIFSVAHDNQSIMLIDPISTVEKPPESLGIHWRQGALKDTPTIEGAQTAYYRFYAGGMLCHHLLASDGLLPEIAKALRAYQSVLAAQRQATLKATPEDLQTPCFLANYIYAPDLYMTKGFPIEQWDNFGNRRSLSDIRRGADIEQSLFALPPDYEYLDIGGNAINF